MNILQFQFPAERLDALTGQYVYKNMSFRAGLRTVVYRPQAKFGFETAENRFQAGLHDIGAPERARFEDRRTVNFKVKRLQ
jgi:hypothetical protein